MSLATRVGAVEDHHLTPKEAVICWMREAHQFDSLLDYGRWLMDQPDAAYPLVRMPGQVVAALRKRNRGTPDHRLHDEIHRVQKDLLFFYFLHKQVNLHVLQQKTALRLRLTLLIERLRNIIYQIGVADDARLARLGLPDDPDGRPPKRWDEKTTEDIALDEALAAWRAEEHRLRQDVRTAQEAGDLISERYLGGEEILFPDSARLLAALLDSLVGFRDVYHHVVGGRPPESREGFMRWIFEEPDVESSGPVPMDPEIGEAEEPDVRAAARRLAESHILMARAEALDTLGERNAGVQLVEDWMRSRE